MKKGTSLRRVLNDHTIDERLTLRTDGERRKGGEERKPQRERERERERERKESRSTPETAVLDYVDSPK